MFVHPTLDVAAEADWLKAQAGKASAKKPRGNPERDFQVDQVAWLRDVLPAGSVVFAVVNESAAKAKTPMARARYQAKRIAAGVCPGFPDLGIALPDARTFYVENKSRTGSLTRSQREVHAKLRDGGHTVIVARTIDQTRAGLIAAGVVLAEDGGHAVLDAKARTVPARIGGSPFPLPARCLPQGFKP